ncbi:MAG: acyl-CoA thioesterase-like protein [Myxococcales bacterium]|nr:acyl-CoA thioesterase-like protein [Myxococcales bacterium]
MTPTDLAADTAVRADETTPGRYHLTLSDRWDYLLPSGGVAMTCALRAAEAALGEPALRFASATTIFCTPIHPVPLVADVTILRRGGSTAQVRVGLRERDAKADPEDPTDNARGLELTATFVRDRKGPDVRGVAMPDVRSLADALPVEDGAGNNPHARFRFYHQVECKVADGELYWVDGLVAGPARYARWMRYKAPQRDAEGRLDRLALPPLIDTMPTALHRAIGPGPYRFYAPSLDLTTYVVDDTDREWLLVAVTLRRAHRGWAIADAEVWDDQGRFIAYGSQAMYLHSVSGEPPVVDASRRT